MDENSTNSTVTVNWGMNDELLKKKLLNLEDSESFKDIAWVGFEDEGGDSAVVMQSATQNAAKGRLPIKRPIHFGKMKNRKKVMMTYNLITKKLKAKRNEFLKEMDVCKKQAGIIVKNKEKSSNNSQNMDLDDLICDTDNTNETMVAEEMLNVFSEDLRKNGIAQATVEDLNDLNKNINASSLSSSSSSSSSSGHNNGNKEKEHLSGLESNQAPPLNDNAMNAEDPMSPLENKLFKLLPPQVIETFTKLQNEGVFIISNMFAVAIAPDDTKYDFSNRILEDNAVSLTYIKDDVVQPTILFSARISDHRALAVVPKNLPSARRRSKLNLAPEVGIFIKLKSPMGFYKHARIVGTWYNDLEPLRLPEPFCRICKYTW